MDLGGWDGSPPPSPRVRTPSSLQSVLAAGEASLIALPNKAIRASGGFPRAFLMWESGARVPPPPRFSSTPLVGGLWSRAGRRYRE